MREYAEKLGYRPRTCVWELTLACNASCLHCASRAGRPRDFELTTGQALRVARELAALGCERVTLSGGEPLLRRDWPAIAEALAGAGLTVGMISNGLAFDDEEARRAAGSGVGHVAFSVDGLEASHDRMRGRSGSFGRTLRAFAAASIAGLPVCAVTQVNRWNVHELDGMHELLRGLGARSWKLQLCNPAGEMAEHRELVLEPRDLLRLVPRIVGLKRRGLPFVEVSDSIGYFGPYEEALRTTWRNELPFWTGCYAGCRAIGIESGGNVKGCLALPSERHGTDAFVEGNVLASPLAEIWARPGGFAYNREFKPRQLTGFCRTCPYGEICRAGCHWTALAHGGTLTENRYCYHRVSVETAAERSGRRRRLARGLAPAAILTTLGLAGCGYGLRLEGDERDIATTDVSTPDAESTSASDVGSDAVEVSPDVSAEAPPDSEVDADVHCPTADEACCACEYMGPLPIPPGCPDPCVSPEYGEPEPVPDAGDADVDTDAAPEDVPGDAHDEVDLLLEDAAGESEHEADADASGDAAADAASDIRPEADGAGCPDPCFSLDYGEPTPIPPGCPYECGGTATCPTFWEACCGCDYDGPEPVPPECEHPCPPPWWWRK